MKLHATLGLGALLAGGALAQTDLGEDFNGAWGSSSNLASPGAQFIRTPVADADNQSLGDWTGHSPGPVNTLYFNNSTGFGADGGSGFSALTANVASGFLVFGESASDETGAYAYTGTFGPIAVSGESRIQFDATVTGLQQAPADIDLRLMLRVPNSPAPPNEAWIISEPISLADAGVTGSVFVKPANWASSRLSGIGTEATVSIAPNTLTWQGFSVPDAQLIPLNASPEQPGFPVGGAVPAFIVEGALLPNVTGLGLYLDTDISGVTPGNFGGVWIDALALIDEGEYVSLPVELSVFATE